MKLGIIRYNDYQKYIVGKNCQIVKGNGWQCKEYITVEKNALDIFRIGTLKSISDSNIIYLTVRLFF